MFDLFRSRAKAVRYLLGGLLMLVALSMVVTLIPGYGTSGGNQDQVIAEIGDEAVTVRDVQQQMQASMRSRAFPPEMAGFYAGQMIDDMISSRALMHQAKKMGLAVSDTELASALRANLPQLFPNGQFVGKDIYAQVLQQQGLTIPEFEASLRQQMLMGRLSSLVADGIVITPADIEREFHRRNDKVKLEYVAISPEKLQSQVNVTPEAIEKFYKGATSAFVIPEKRSLDLLVAEEARIGQGITVSDDELRRAYNQNREQYRIPERVHARHILLKTTGKPKEDVPKIRAQAEQLLKQVKGGADFAELAKKSSEDPISAAKGGDLGWIVRGQTVPAFESAAFSLKPNELSGVITTEYGFHILQVLEKETAHVKTFDEVKDQIAQEFKRQRLFDALQRSADQAHDELVKHPEQAAAIAAKYNLNVIHADNVAPGGSVPEMGNNPDFNDAISGLKKGGVTPVMQAPGNKLLVAVVSDVQPARQAQMAEVEGQIRSQLVRQLAVELAIKKSAEVADKVKAAGDNFAAVAKQMGLEVKSTQEFGQDGAADGVGPGSALPQAFRQPIGSTFGPAVIGDQRFVCKIVSRKEAELSQLDDATRTALRNELKQEKGKQRVDLFMDSVRAALKREGEIKVHKDVMDRVIGSYRS